MKVCKPDVRRQCFPLTFRPLIWRCAAAGEGTGQDAGMTLSTEPRQTSLAQLGRPESEPSHAFQLAVPGSV